MRYAGTSSWKPALGSFDVLAVSEHGALDDDAMWQAIHHEARDTAASPPEDGRFVVAGQVSDRVGDIVDPKQT
jgi:hypothetical protein